MTDNEIRQVLVHPAVWPHLIDWLSSRGITLGRIPDGELEDGLPTYVMTPTAALPEGTQRCDALAENGSRCVKGSEHHEG